jgi:DtxR family Mn-dependent transcriptional regulator
MTDPSATRSSSSVGDYVKAIWELAGSGVAATHAVALRLSVSSASVTNMFVRLQEMGLVEYERYRGVSLTEAGRNEALQLVRRHRLIETFLLEHLGYSWEEVHDEAEHLEHVVSERFTQRLADLLGHPGHDPHGAPIPSADGTLLPDDSVPLSGAVGGRWVRISRISQDDVSVLTYLGERGLVPGRVLKVKEVRALDGVVTIEGEDGSIYVLGDPLARMIFIQSVPN